MYRVSPMTYLIDGMLSTGTSGAMVTCAGNEYLRFDPPSGDTCGTYMLQAIAERGGKLLDANATAECSYCPLDNTDQFLSAVSSHPKLMWRNFGIMWAFIVFNCVAAMLFYWLVRVPKNRKNREQATIESGKEGKKA